MCTEGRYDRLLSKDTTTSNQSSQHLVYQSKSVYDRLKAKSLASVCNSEHREDGGSPPGAVPEELRLRARELWSGEIVQRSTKSTEVSEKVKVEHQQSNASNDSGMEMPALPPEERCPDAASNCAHVVEKVKVEHQQSNMSNDSGVVTLASDSISLQEVWSQKSSLSEAMVMELEEDGVAEDPFSGCENGCSSSSSNISAHPRFRTQFGTLESDI